MPRHQGGALERALENHPESRAAEKGPGSMGARGALLALWGGGLKARARLRGGSSTARNPGPELPGR